MWKRASVSWTQKCRKDKWRSQRQGCNKMYLRALLGLIHPEKKVEMTLAPWVCQNVSGKEGMDGLMGQGCTQMCLGLETSTSECIQCDHLSPDL